jgi:hypothetical protein
MAGAISIYDQLKFVHSTPQTNANEIAEEIQLDSLPDAQMLCVGLNIEIARDGVRGRDVYAATTTPLDRKADPANKGAGSGPKALTVVCDTLVVTCRWWLPQCDVKIFARQIIFQGDGCIDTSPVPWQMAKAADAVGSRPGEKGEGGRTAGDVSILAGEVHVPAGRPAKRIIASGGHGQGGGRGVRGNDGRNSPGNRLGITGAYQEKDAYTDSKVQTRVSIKLDKHGDHTIIGIRRRWKVLTMQRSEYVWGTSEFPTSGTDAIAPGDSGSGGNGGKIYSNAANLLALTDNAAGKAGALAPMVKGGAAGWPDKAAFYDNTYYYLASIQSFNPFNVFSNDTYSHENSSSAETSVEKKVFTNGADKSAKPGENGRAFDPELAKSNKSNLWLHPYIVPIVQDYVRRTYLSEQREEARAMLAAYEPALREGMPARAKGTDWTADDEAYWESVALEFATLDQRLAAGLDYFGNPAGFMPLLSLSSSFRQYKLELEAALEVLVFASWMAAKQRANQVVTGASKVAAGLLAKENRAIAAQIIEAETRVGDIAERISAIGKNQNALAEKIGDIRTTLTNKAAGEVARITQIKFAANLAGGLLQLVPYGQPALGGVASIAADATDYLDEDTDKATAKLKAKVAETVKDYKDAQKAAKDLVDEAKKKAKEFAKAEKKELTVDELKTLNDTSNPAWKTALKGVGPALNHLKAAYEKGQVTRVQIDAQLAKLAAADPEWLKLSAELERLAEDKATLLSDLASLAQSMGQQSSIISSNAAAVSRLDSKGASAASRMLGTSASKAIEEMQRRAAMALTEALYSLVRAFEGAQLKPVTVDWSNTAFIKALNQSIDDEPMDKWDDDKVAKRIKTLSIAFNETLRNVRRQLAKTIPAKASGDGVSSKHFALDASLGAGKLADLNDGKWIAIDTLELDFVSPNNQGELLAGIKPLAIAFAEPDLPDRGDLNLRLEVDDIGIVRDGTSLFGLRLPSPVVFECTYHFDTKAFSEKEPSKAANDLLNIVLDDMKEEVKQRLAMPSAWGVLRAQVSYSNMGRKTPPTITRIGLEARIDARAAPRDQRVLRIASRDGFTPVSLGDASASPVLSGYFVFPSARSQVALSSADAARPVRKWIVTRGGRTNEKPGPTLDLAIDLHTTVEAEFAG